MIGLTALFVTGLAGTWLGGHAVRSHRALMADRRQLLQHAQGLLRESQTLIPPHQFPVISGRVEDGRPVRIELIADTLVARRLPQLWLSVTLGNSGSGPRLGALARPTGAEHYALVHDLPQWMPPPDTGTPMLMRGNGKATAAQVASVCAHFRSLFADPQVKEAVLAPQAARILCQVAEGDRSAHLLLRQARFPLAAVPAETLSLALARAQHLSELLLLEPGC